MLMFKIAIIKKMRCLVKNLAEMIWAPFSFQRHNLTVLGKKDFVFRFGFDVFQSGERTKSRKNDFAWVHPKTCSL